ncbi:uncharacterized protein UDID_02367 [Ustilago sp. UG-2017a]|nr:uncharacterized protein UDID_02367 [Ustilago sp. UG-2017a]
MGKKTKLSAGKAAAKAAKKEKAEKKATSKLTKQVAKQKSQSSTTNSTAKGKSKQSPKKVSIDDDQEDLDALLAKYREQWESEHVVSEEKVGGPPSRRANASFTPCPLGNDLYLFGGEYFNGERVSFYQDMYRYIPDKNEWRTYASKTQPGPRSAHQIAATPAQGGMLWLFGGEFSGARQNAFHHYRDLWAFSIETKAWERIDTKLRPSARSGHRMCFWKHYLVLFGGFIDTGVKTQYLNDLWIFDTQNTFKWVEIKQNDLRRPPPRSGFSFLPEKQGVVLHGGYCKKGMGRWVSLNLKRPKKKAGGRRKKKPNPVQIQQQQRGNGYDSDNEDGHHYRSDNDNDEGEGGEGGEDLTGSTEQLCISDSPEPAPPPPQPAEEEEEEDPDDPLKTIPLERYNVMLAVQRNILYVYGGIFESDNREYTLDDFYTLDLTKLDRFNCLQSCPIDALEWDESSSSSDSGSDCSSSSSSSESEGEEGDELPEGFEFDPSPDSSIELTQQSKLSAAEKETLRARAQAFIGVASNTARTEQEILSTPQPGESLRLFYERTKLHWASIAILQSQGKLRGKEMRKQAFALADGQYREYKPILEEIERIRDEAGLDEKEVSVNKVGGIGAGSTGVDSRNRR